ncbi:MAG: 3-oxoacid CoA-transferase subunit B [Alphaproteobacteria bacterium]|nr:3-oxoacid CoA-transferase subunit B [Alphaproteobacteria bacterium]MBQ6853900.1 3-oxoacid CoA-transferase subunit B [Alphaproteobacteria bacterium]MBR3913523.1 3-oxoacid CoA-transferase subunit B [Alphaproteobacteria bacterium]
MLTKEEIRHRIAKRVAQEFNDGDIVTLGIGLPTLAADYIEEGKHVTLQSENGVIGVGKTPDEANSDERITNAGGKLISLIEGGCYFDSFLSFGMIRGGHINATVLGCLQVDMEGNIANWLVPGKLVPGMGGAMDLVVGAQKVIVAMEHTAKGEPKILKKCTLPLTAIKEVDMIITEKGVFTRDENGLTLIEISDISSLEDIRQTTEAPFQIAPSLAITLK